MEYIENMTLEDVKYIKAEEIKDFDHSWQVNEFFINNKSMWFDKGTRVGLINSIQIEKASGRETTELWAEGQKYVIPCDIALQMLATLELYALECYNVTAKHLKAVNELTDIEDIIMYNYTSDYPKKLKFTIQ